MRFHLGDGYTEALREAYKELPATLDLVMYWWHKSAHLLVNGDIKRFGLITTNSITQPFNRVTINETLFDFYFRHELCTHFRFHKKLTIFPFPEISSVPAVR